MGDVDNLRSEVPDHFRVEVMIEESEETAPVSEITDIPVTRKDFEIPQLQTPNMTNAWKNVRVINRVPQEPEVSPLYPHFAVYHDL